MRTPMVTICALFAFIPFGSAAADCPLQPLPTGSVCTINGAEWEGDPEVIEGTRKADDIDCRASLLPVEIYGDSGDDTICGSDWSDFIAGGGGNDTIFGGNGDDAIDGGAKDDDLYGEGGNDIIFGGVGASPASGVGCELLTSAAARVYLAKGGSGDDSIYGGDGDDCVNAGSGEDVVEGGPGNDTLKGGNHADVIDGGAGLDHIDGGWHSDTCLAGGDGAIIVDCE